MKLKFVMPEEIMIGNKTIINMKSRIDGSGFNNVLFLVSTDFEKNAYLKKTFNKYKNKLIIWIDPRTLEEDVISKITEDLDTKHIEFAFIIGNSHIVNVAKISLLAHINNINNVYGDCNGEMFDRTIPFAVVASEPYDASGASNCVKLIHNKRLFSYYSDAFVPRYFIVDFNIILIQNHGAFKNYLLSKIIIGLDMYFLDKKNILGSCFSLGAVEMIYHEAQNMITNEASYETLAILAHADYSLVMAENMLRQNNRITIRESIEYLYRNLNIKDIPLDLVISSLCFNVLTYYNNKDENFDIVAKKLFLNFNINSYEEVTKALEIWCRKFNIKTDSMCWLTETDWHILYEAINSHRDKKIIKELRNIL